MAVRSYLNRLKFWKRTIDQGDPINDPEYQLANKLQRFEKYVAQIQSIVMWDNPAVSIIWIVFINILFWVVASLEWRFYGLVSTALLAMTVYDAWTGHVWPEISIRAPERSSPAAGDAAAAAAAANPSVLAVSKFLTCARCQLTQGVQRLRNFRQTQPGLFCCISSAVCSLLLVMGRWVSGLLLVYCLVMVALLGPRLYTSCVPPALRCTITQYALCVQNAFNYYGAAKANDEDYLPLTTSEDIALLSRASDMRHDTYDSITNPGSSSDMALGMEVMPSHEEDSLDNLSDLEPLVEPATARSQLLEFESGLFIEDLSSDEEQFSRDLVFPEADERDSAPAASRALSSLIAQAVTSNMLGSVGLLANVIRARPTPTLSPTPATPDSWSDSDFETDDFEIISQDELDSQDLPPSS